MHDIELVFVVFDFQNDLNQSQSLGVFFDIGKNMNCTPSCFILLGSCRFEMDPVRYFWETAVFRTIPSGGYHHISIGF